MDYPKAHRLPKNYFINTYKKNSKAAFMSSIAVKCQDKEDVTACTEKYEKAFDSVFGYLNEKLFEEERATFIFDRRYNICDSVDASIERWVKLTGYENWS